MGEKKSGGFLTALFRKRLAKEKEASPEQALSKNVTAPSALAPTVDPLVAMRSDLSEGAAFFCEFRKDVTPFQIPSELGASNLVDDSGVEYLRLSDGPAGAPSAWHTGGYSIRLPDTIETQASGHHIVISVVARAVGGRQSRFALAYSTNDVGNSGWRWFDAGLGWCVYATEWDVPVMKNGNGDFLGILPDVQGNPGVDLCYLAVTIV